MKIVLLRYALATLVASSIHAMVTEDAARNIQRTWRNYRQQAKMQEHREKLRQEIGDFSFSHSRLPARDIIELIVQLAPGNTAREFSYWLRQQIRHSHEGFFPVSVATAAARNVAYARGYLATRLAAQFPGIAESSFWGELRSETLKNLFADLRNWEWEARPRESAPAVCVRLVGAIPEQLDLVPGDAVAMPGMDVIYVEAPQQLGQTCAWNALDMILAFEQLFKERSHTGLRSYLASQRLSALSPEERRAFSAQISQLLKQKMNTLERGLQDICSFMAGAMTSEWEEYASEHGLDPRITLRPQGIRDQSALLHDLYKERRLEAPVVTLRVSKPDDDDARVVCVEDSMPHGATLEELIGAVKSGAIDRIHFSIGLDGNAMDGPGVGHAIAASLVRASDGGLKLLVADSGFPTPIGAGTDEQLRWYVNNRYVNNIRRIRALGKQPPLQASISFDEEYARSLPRKERMRSYARVIQAIEQWCGR